MDFEGFSSILDSTCITTINYKKGGSELIMGTLPGMLGERLLLLLDKKGIPVKAVPLESIESLTFDYSTSQGEASH